MHMETVLGKRCSPSAFQFFELFLHSKNPSKDFHALVRAPSPHYSIYLLLAYTPFYSLLYISSIFNQKINKNQNYITEELAYLNIILINMLSELISSMTIYL